jgi:hypothetical protein
LREISVGKACQPLPKFSSFVHKKAAPCRGTIARIDARSKCFSAKPQALLRDRQRPNAFARRRECRVRNHGQKWRQSRFAQACRQIVGFQGMHFDGRCLPQTDKPLEGVTPLYSAQQRLRSGKQTLTVRTSQRPGIVALDPFHKMIERSAGNNSRIIDALPVNKSGIE